MYLYRVGNPAQNIRLHLGNIRTTNDLHFGLDEREEEIYQEQKQKGRLHLDEQLTVISGYSLQEISSTLIKGVLILSR